MLSCSNANEYKLEIIEKERWWMYGGTDNLFLRKGDNSKQIMRIGTADDEIKAPQIPKLYNEFEQNYYIKEIHGREVSADTKDLSEKLNFNEFETLANCLLQNKGRKEFAYLPNRLIYGKKTRITKTDSTLLCLDKSKIKVDGDGDTDFIYSIDEKSYDILGEFDKSNEFTRYVGKITIISSPSDMPSYLQDEYDSSQNELVKITEKSNNYQRLLPKDLAQKLYDQNGPKTDYLQTCKNSEGKTIFEIFKN